MDDSTAKHLCRQENDDRRAVSLELRSNWSFERRRSDRRVVNIAVAKDRRSGGDRRTGADRRRRSHTGIGGRPGSSTPITTWLTRRFPDDFLSRSGDVSERIQELVLEHWPSYEMASQAELITALIPILSDLLEDGSHVTENHRDRCEREIVSWLSRHSPKAATRGDSAPAMRQAI